MFARLNPSSPLRLLVGMACIAVVVLSLHAAASVLAPIVLSLFIAILCAPILRWLQRSNMPTWLALLLMFLILFLCIGLLCLFIAISLNNLINQLPSYQQRLSAQINSVRPTLESWGLDLHGSALANTLDISEIFGTLSYFLRTAVQGLTSSFLIVLGTTFALLETRYLPQRLRQAGVRATHILAIGEQFSHTAPTFVYLRAINNAIVASGATVFLLLYGIDFALLWGVLIFFLSYIPNVGIIIACIPPVILALLQHGIVGALIVIAVLFVINLLGDNVITPRLMGPGLNLAPSVVFFSFLIWTWIFGVVGALLSVPLTVLLKLILEANPETRWLAAVMSSRQLGVSGATSNGATGEQEGGAQQRQPDA